MATHFVHAVQSEMTAEVVRNFGQARLRVTGTSMMPSVWPGDVITVRRRSIHELSIGCIVLCYRNQAFVAHRLIGKRDDALITRGDALAYDDSPVREAEVLGEVVGILREGRKVSLSAAWWHSLGCHVMRHSELCTRILLRLRRPSRLSWAE